MHESIIILVVVYMMYKVSHFCTRKTTLSKILESIERVSGSSDPDTLATLCTQLPDKVE
jgi:hypothetical protein